VDSDETPDVRPTATVDSNSRRECADTTPTADELEQELGSPLASVLR
jgi:hypothetical protein